MGLAWGWWGWNVEWGWHRVSLQLTKQEESGGPQSTRDPEGLVDGWCKPGRGKQSVSIVDLALLFPGQRLQRQVWGSHVREVCVGVIVGGRFAASRTLIGAFGCCHCCVQQRQCPVPIASRRSSWLFRRPGVGAVGLVCTW